MRHLFAALTLSALLAVSSLALAQTPPPATPKAPTFKQLDVNGDGRLSLDEVLASAKKQGAQVKPFRLSEVDLDGDGLLTQEELKKAGITGLEREGVIRARDLDISGDGYVSREDLDEYFKKKQREAFAKADTDRDGWLREPEFTLLRF